jgi:hypothetical protein
MKPPALRPFNKDKASGGFIVSSHSATPIAALSAISLNFLSSEDSYR